MRRGVRPLVLEEGRTVGGPARTVEYKSFLFDIGGRCFFTRIPVDERTWRKVLGKELPARSRLSCT